MWLSEFESQLCGLEKGAWETMLLKMYQWTVAKFTPVKYTPCCDHLLRKKYIVLLDFLLSSNSSIYIPVMYALMPHAIGNHWSRTFTAALKLRGLKSSFLAMKADNVTMWVRCSAGWSGKGGMGNNALENVSMNCSKVHTCQIQPLLWPPFAKKNP